MTQDGGDETAANEEVKVSLEKRLVNSTIIKEKTSSICELNNRSLIIFFSLCSDETESCNDCYKNTSFNFGLCFMFTSAKLT